MRARDLIVALLDTPLDAEVEVPGAKVTGIAQVERPGGSPDGMAYVTLATAPVHQGGPPVNRLISQRIVRPGDPRVIYETVAVSDYGIAWPADLIRDLTGPFIIERRFLPDGPWEKIASGTDGFGTLVRK